VSRRSDYWGYAEIMSTGAEEMWKRLPAAKPERVHAKLYLGAARVADYMQDRLSAEELDEGEAALEEFLAAVPDSDRGWGTLITGRLVRTERTLDSGNVTRADEMLETIRADLAKAQASVTDGPEVMIAALQVANYEHRLNPGSVNPAEILPIVERVYGVVRKSNDPWLITEAVTAIQRLDWLAEVPETLPLLEDYLAENPDSHRLRLVLATMQYFTGDLDGAEATTKVILDAELLTVSFMSQLQFALKRRAASLNVDIAVRRWDLSDLADRAARLSDIRDRIKAFEDWVTDADNDALFVRAQGKLAFAEGDYSRAASLFNRLIREIGQSVDVESRMYAAISFEQQGELGAAVEQITEALERRPDNTRILAHQARLLGQIGQYEEAVKLLDRVLAIDAEDETVAHLRRELIGLMSGDGDGENPIQEALATAQASVDAGEFEVARATLLAMFEQAPDNLRLLNGLVRVEMAAGEKDSAQHYLDIALEIAPMSRTFRTLRTKLENPDPIAAVKQYITEVYTGEIERTVEILLAMRALARKQEADAERFATAGDTDLAGKAGELAKRARSEELAYRAKVETLDSEHDRFIEYRFLEAVDVAVETDAWDEVESIAVLAADNNVDEVGGAMYRGRMYAARGDTERAVQEFSDATDSIPYSAMPWRMLAMSHQTLGNYPEAISAFERSHANNPNDITTVKLYGQLLDRTGNKTRALMLFKRAKDLAPTDVALREYWLRLESQVGDPAEGLRERRRRYAREPGDVRNAAALATFLGKIEPTRELLLKDDGSEQYTSDRWGRMSATGRQSQQTVLAEARLAWYAEADDIMDAIASPDDRDLGWYMLRADLWRSRGDVAAGEAALRGYIDGETGVNRLGGMLALGMYEAHAERVGAAVSMFEQARELQDDEIRSADLALAELFFKLRRYKEAIPRYQAVMEVDSSRRIRLKLAECQVKLRQFPQARQTLGDIEADVTGDAQAVLLEAAIVLGEADALWDQGQLDAAERAYADQLALIEDAKHADPSSPLPYVMQANNLLRQHRHGGDRVLLDDALMALGSADEVQVGFVQTSLARVAIHQAKGDDRAAINELTQLMETSPDHEEGRLILVQMRLNDNRPDDAIKVVQDALDRNPASTVWLERLGDIHLGIKRDAEGAAKYYAAAIAVLADDPTPGLIGKLAEAYINQQPPRKNDAIELLALHADQFDESPRLRAIYARTLDAVGRRNDALDQMRLAYTNMRTLIKDGVLLPAAITNWYTIVRAVFAADEVSQAEAFVMENSGGTLDAYEMASLASIWRASGVGGLSRSEELLRQAVREAPVDDVAFQARAYSDLAIVLILTQQNEAARTALEKVIELNPEHGEGLNNLAYLLAEALGKPEEALPYAKRAATLNPTAWSMLDTLGWIYYRLEQWDDAVATLQQSCRLEEKASNLYHLAASYFKSGDLTRAERAGVKAGGMNPDRKTLAEINRLMDDIRTRSNKP